MNKQINQQKRISIVRKRAVDVAISILFAIMLNKNMKGLNIVKKVWREIDGRKRYYVIKLAARYSRKWAGVLALLESKMYEEEIPEFLATLSLKEFLKLKQVLMSL